MWCQASRLADLVTELSERLFLCWNLVLNSDESYSNGNNNKNHKLQLKQHQIPMFLITSHAPGTVCTLCMGDLSTPNLTSGGWCSFIPSVFQEREKVKWLALVLFTYFLIPFIFISSRLITLQYCSGFCHMLTWISHGFTCVPHPDPPSHLPLHPIPLGLPSAPGLSTWLMHPTWAGDLFHPR